MTSIMPDTIPAKPDFELPTEDELAKAVEEAYQTGLATIPSSTPPVDYSSIPRLRVPKSPSGLGKYSSLLAIC